jgi:hypothetical protein
MSTKIQRYCAWSIIPFLAIFLFGFGIVAGFLPPQAPTQSAATLAAFYALHHAAIENGQLICILATFFLFFWPAAISAQIARIERGPFPLLAAVQYASAIVLCLLFMLCSLIWSIAAYRPDMPPDILRTLNDSAWLIFVVAYPEYAAQMLSIAIAGFIDKRPQPFLPRWACWATVLEALIGGGGIFAGFVTTGPLAWNGLIGFWIPIASFVIWLLGVMLPNLLKAITAQEKGPSFL